MRKTQSSGFSPKLALLLLLAVSTAWITFSASRHLLRSISPEILKQSERVRVLTASAPKILAEAEQKKLDDLKKEYRQETQWVTIGLAFILLFIMIILERLSEKWGLRDEKNPADPEYNDAPAVPDLIPAPAAATPLSLLIEDLQDASSEDAPLNISSHRASLVLKQAVDHLLPLIRTKRCQLQSRVLSGGERIDGTPDFWLECDLNRTTRALVYLVETVVKASKANELIAVLAEKTEKDVLFLVADDGDGMEQSELERLLTAPIWETPSIGISLAATLAKKIGGQIWGESKVGKGTKLYFRIPVSGGAITEGLPLKTEIQPNSAAPSPSESNG